MLDRKQEIVSAGEFIMLIRRREGLSQRELAAKCGLSNACISTLELGISINPTVKTITELAKALNEIIAWDLFLRFQAEQERARLGSMTEDELEAITWEQEAEPV